MSKLNERNVGSGSRFKAVLLYVWGIILNKVVEGIVVAIGGALAIYFGWSSGLLDRWIGSNDKEPPIATSSEWKDDKPKKILDVGPSIAEGNVGFRRHSKYLGMSSEFMILEPGSHKSETPFTEVKSGTHSLDWAVKTTLSEGGLMGFGATKSYMLTQGTLQGNFSRSSLVTLLKKGEEDFLTKGLLPEIRSGVQEAEAALAKDKRVVDDSTYTSDLRENVETQLRERLDKKLSIDNVTIQVKSVSILKEADLNDPQLEKLTSNSITRIVPKAIAVVSFASPGFEGGLAMLFLTVAAVFLVFLFLNFMFHFS
jgi:hypothetical protein